MKKTKKFLAALIALVMMLAMTVPAYAAPAGNDGTITVNNAIEGKDYSAYKILDLVRYNNGSAEGEGAYYIYQAVAPWDNFVNGDDVKGVYLDVDEDNYVTWHEGADAAAFAKLALAYAKANDINPTAGPETADETKTVEFTNLDLGYYLVDSSVGALCMLNTTNKTAEIEEKNDVPTIEKEIVDSDKTPQESTATIGDTVDYKVTINVKPGAESYVMHDQMTAGLTFNDDVAIAGLTEGVDYTVEKTNDDNCTFEIVFSQAYLNAITTAAALEVTYSATLNEDAVIAGDNQNSVKLAYGDKNDVNETPTSTVTTKTYEFELVKTDADNALIEGAEFSLTAEGSTDAIEFVLEGNDYRVATAEEIADENVATTTTIVAGDVKVIGLENGTYSLTETKAPKGFNELTDPIEVVIADANLDANVADGVWQNGGVHVVNQAGGLLPSTGGIGTTIFYIGGGVLVLAAVIFLVTKKRVSSEEA